MKNIGIILTLLGIFLISLISVNAITATIQGSVYDLTLDKVNNVILEINTIPEQTYVAKIGDYSFESIPVGDYVIKAYTQDRSLITTENITINQEGTYTIDLFLIPEFEEKETKSTNYLYYIIPFILILILIAIIYKRLKIPKKVELKIEGVKDDLEKVIEIIKKEGGRTTQKDIREKIGLSEAKVSLMIVELEDKGIIKKIKKGRGNIIILNK
ncbi:MAG: winged helix-turn-helix transcriptional regulator [Candidatus Nanoarchaeia archaeon]|nr:winged helix-turn-helix transcriptional regulator [Candidatus Nanoarchaeia archaeon]MDD5587691.1 winged helix-turn-helix transcriptional regulator [Candidatus Nanoarchaeia archaeon]